MKEFEKLGYSQEELEDIANNMPIVPDVYFVSIEDMQLALEKALGKYNRK